MSIRTITLVAVGWGALAASAMPSQAFWERSQLQTCADATTESERFRRRCWELDPYLAPGLAVAPGWGGSFGPEEGRRGLGRSKGGGVTRRLG